MDNGMKVSPLSADHPVSFPSEGPVLDDRGFQITNDHSTLTKVAGKEVWLHRDKHHFTGDEVHMRYDHAVDSGLVQAEEPIPEEDKVPEVQPEPAVIPLAQGKAGHKPDDVNYAPKTNSNPGSSQQFDSGKETKDELPADKNDKINDKNNDKGKK